MQDINFPFTFHILFCTFLKKARKKKDFLKFFNSYLKLQPDLVKVIILNLQLID